jgi:phospholipid-binding lipoprotein MlaA
MRTLKMFGAAAAALSLSGGFAFAQPAMAPVTLGGPEEGAGPDLNDPFEGFNRSMFAVHNVLDKAILEPAALGYRYIVPRVVRKGVRNVLSNVSSPVVFANDVLQGKVKRAGTTAARFGVNTTIGVAGVFDVASGWGLEKHNEDFGQTLGVWGLGGGPYLFIPGAGPTNFRDLFGRVVDTGLDPLTYATFDGDQAVRASRFVLTGLDIREQAIEPVRDLYAQSSDPYASIRRFYAAARLNAIRNGAVDVEGLPEFDTSTPGEEAVPPPQVAPATEQPGLEGVAPTPDMPEGPAPAPSPEGAPVPETH